MGVNSGWDLRQEQIAFFALFIHTMALEPAIEVLSDSFLNVDRVRIIQPANKTRLIR